ncbi:MAG TPA: DHH family phosphoesterase, partial [Gemmatimonadaceae bacterium]|nr:DHH family phosphoesterase [Gemmatimonadaceae bacterium]
MTDLNVSEILAVAPGRAADIDRLAASLAPARTVALSTHINADGDGCGSEVAFALLLRQRGITARIVNPTPWPDLFRFLLDDVEDASPRGAAALRGVDVLVVLDINDVRRLGTLADAVRGLRVPRLVIDHHVPSDEPAGSVVFSDTRACATGELVYDVARHLGLEVTPAVARAIYTAILTDTGGFRFSNTSPRAHAIAADLLAAGVQQEEIYRQVYASAPVGRVRLLAEVLQSLGIDEGLGLSWLSMRAGALEAYHVRQEDLDGIVEHARAIGGVRMAIFFRDLGHGKVKASFRSTGAVDVNAFARRYGGGGHARAAGALLTGSLDEV